MTATPFEFKSRLALTELLGRKAATLPELIDGIRTVPPSSIYHHTHRFLQHHHFLSPEPPNDFANELGKNGREHIRQNFLITRHLREYLLLSLSLFHDKDIVYL